MDIIVTSPEEVLRPVPVLILFQVGQLPNFRGFGAVLSNSSRSLHSVC